MIIRRGKYWHYDFEFQGKRYAKSTGLRTVDGGGKRQNYDLAKKAEAEVRAKLYRGEEIVPETNLSFSEFVTKRVMKAVEVNNHDKPRTVKFYAQTYARIAQDEFGKLKIRKITKADVTDFKSRAHKSNLAVATINRRLACIRKALRLAYEENAIAKVPKIEMLSGEKRREAVLPKGLDRDVFLAGIGDQHRPAIEFLFETGLRVSELCTLTKDRVFFKPVAYIQVHREVSKSKKDRFVPLTPRAQEIIKQEMKRSLSQYAFVRFGPGVVGNRNVEKKELHQLERSLVWPLSRHTLSQVFRRRAKEMGLRGLVLHSTRHSAATEVGGRGADVFSLMSAFGWETPEIAKRYVHPIQENMLKYFGVESVPTVTPALSEKG